MARRWSSGCGCGVYGRHQTLDDAELVVDNLGEGREAVCRARGVRDDVDVRRVFVQAWVRRSRREQR